MGSHKQLKRLFAYLQPIGGKTTKQEMFSNNHMLRRSGKRNTKCLSFFLKPWTAFQEADQHALGVTWFTSPLHLGRCLLQVLHLWYFYPSKNKQEYRQDPCLITFAVVYITAVGGGKLYSKQSLRNIWQALFGESISWHLLFVTQFLVYRVIKIICP